MFNFLIFFQKDVSLEGHYNEAYHGKDPMDDIGGTIKNLVTKAAPILATLKIHNVKRVKEGNSFVNKFYYLSDDLEPFFTRKYGVQCGQKTRGISDDNICNHCEYEYVAGKDGFNALSALSVTMNSASMNRSWTFASSYFIYSILIVTRS